MVNRFSSFWCRVGDNVYSCLFSLFVCYNVGSVCSQLFLFMFGGGCSVSVCSMLVNIFRCCLYSGRCLVLWVEKCVILVVVLFCLVSRQWLFGSGRKLLMWCGIICSLWLVRFRFVIICGCSSDIVYDVIELWKLGWKVLVIVVLLIVVWCFRISMCLLVWVRQVLYIRLL